MAQITLTNGNIEVKESAIDLVQDCRNREFIQVTHIAHRHNQETEILEENDVKIWINKIHIIKFTD